MFVDPLQTRHHIRCHAHTVVVDHFHVDQLCLRRDAHVRTVGSLSIACDGAGNMGAVSIIVVDGDAGCLKEPQQVAVERLRRELVAIAFQKTCVDKNPAVAVNIVQIPVGGDTTVHHRYGDTAATLRRGFVPHLIRLNRFHKSAGQVGGIDSARRRRRRRWRDGVLCVPPFDFDVVDKDLFAEFPI